MSLKKLNAHLRTLKPAPAGQARVGNMDVTVRKHIQTISDHLIKKSMTIEEFHKMLDTNNDNSVDRAEFTKGVKNLIPTLSEKELSSIFDAIDVNNDQYLSVSEFSRCLQGAKLNREQRISNLDPMVVSDVKNEIKNMFQLFDKNGDNKIVAEEIRLAMVGMG